MRELAGGRQMKGVWHIPAPDRDEKRFGKHPTQKPVVLLERILLAASNEGDLVLDPFMGSGTTAVAALRLRRTSVAMEKDATWIKLALVRVLSELMCVIVCAESLFTPLDLRAIFVDRSVGEAAPVPMALPSRVVHCERKYYFVGACEREVVFSVVAESLEDAWRHFESSPHQAQQILSVIKTETEIYLTQ